jgi:hypothetical protein
MAWQTPKQNWTAGDVPVAEDFNRIEGNTLELKDSKADQSSMASHVSNTSNPHGVTAAQVGAVPSAHVGSGGNAHAVATTSQAGFMSVADKVALGNKVDKPTSATSGNIAVFDDGPGAIKDGGPLDIFLESYRVTGKYTVEIAAVPGRSVSPDYFINTGMSCKSISFTMQSQYSGLPPEHAIFGLKVGGGDGALKFETGGNNSNRWLWQAPLTSSDSDFEYLKDPNDIPINFFGLYAQLFPDGRLRFYRINSMSSDRDPATVIFRWWAK